MQETRLFKIYVIHVLLKYTSEYFTSTKKILAQIILLYTTVTIQSSVSVTRSPWALTLSWHFGEIFWRGWGHNFSLWKYLQGNVRGIFQSEMSGFWGIFWGGKG